MPPKRTINIDSARIGEGGKFEGKFTPKKNPDYIPKRLGVWDRLYKNHQDKIAKSAAKNTKPIKITLPDGNVKEGTSFQTTPMDIAMGISKTLAGQVVIAEVHYTDAFTDELKGDVMATSLSDSEDEDAGEENKGVLWDLTRPLEGNCKLELLKWDNPKGTEAFWHSSAHVLGSALEELYGGHLCVGPPLESGFYYDIFVGDQKINESAFPDIQAAFQKMVNDKVSFDRCVITKEEALELFQDNPFKVQLITTKVPDGALTSAYKCGNFIDLCRGPHVPTTERIKSFMCTKNSSAYWLGKAEYDSLQRIYGISFPDDKRMKDYKKMLEEAAERDHRSVGTKQELFFFHSTVSPGSCFWQPMGARIYNGLVEFMRREYAIRDFQEVISPNIYSEWLFKRSGHYQNYKDCMYGFNVEGEEWFLKPMNCPGHCMIFDHRVRSYKELPMRMASFGVLHRNELSGTLSGLTRVRRFQQDDAHIFCRPDQIKAEVAGALEFLHYVYGVFGFEFSVALSTRPKKAIGEKAVWDKAEAALKEALNESGLDWSLNPGDGAFYGPKIDIRLKDAMMRRHQCGTIQLDFQLPIRFNLQYRAEGNEEEEKDSDDEKPAAKAEKKDKKGTSPNDAAIQELSTAIRTLKEKLKAQGTDSKAMNDNQEIKDLVAKMTALRAADSSKDDKKKEKAAPKAAADAPKEEEKTEEQPKKGEYVWKEQPVKAGFERPVIIHRAILGSVERFVAILTEHHGGKWPFFVSPRQIMIIPIAPSFNEYAKYVCDTLKNFGFYAEFDESSSTLNKKVRNAQIAQWNYAAIVGEAEEKNFGVNLRMRGEKNAVGDFSLGDLIKRLQSESNPSSVKFNELKPYKGRMPLAEAPASSTAAPGAAQPAQKGGAKGASAPAAQKAAAGTEEAHLADHPYLGGFAPCKQDATLYESLKELPKTPNMARWYEHISSFTSVERNSWK